MTTSMICTITMLALAPSSALQSMMKASAVGDLASETEADVWNTFVERLQDEYSVALYQETRQIDQNMLNVIWLDLLDASTLGLLIEIGVCNRGPRLPDRLLLAPYSSTAPAGTVWRYTELPVGGLPSHSWVEVTHTALAEKDQAQWALPWFYVAHGSGVSINVGRTFLWDETNKDCFRGTPKDRSEIMDCMAEGRDLSQFDSIQILHAFDPGWDESVTTWQHGFRHEILLLSSDFLYEHQSLQLVVNGFADDPSPPVMCGKFPRLFKCNRDNPILQYMDENPLFSTAGICNNKTRMEMMWNCSLNVTPHKCGIDDMCCEGFRP